MAAEAPVSQVERVAGPHNIQVSLSELHALRAGVAWFDQALQLRLYEQIQDIEGRVPEYTIFKAAQHLVGAFTSQATQINGFKEAVTDAYLSGGDRTIRIHHPDNHYRTWWDITLNKTSEKFSGSSDMHHKEGLNIIDQDGVGFSARRDWWTGKNRDRSARVSYVSDPRVLRDGQLPVGHHSDTQLALDLSKEFLDAFLTETIVKPPTVTPVLVTE